MLLIAVKVIVALNSATDMPIIFYKNRHIRVNFLGVLFLPQTWLLPKHHQNNFCKEILIRKTSVPETRTAAYTYMSDNRALPSKVLYDTFHFLTCFLPTSPSYYSQDY
jgi:hypothetical protein